MEQELTAYQEALEIDNFLKVLKPHERISVHQFRTGRRNDVEPPVEQLQAWAIKNKYNKIEFKYSVVRELEYYNIEVKKWLPVEKITLERLMNHQNLKQK